MSHVMLGDWRLKQHQTINQTKTMYYCNALQCDAMRCNATHKVKSAVEADPVALRQRSESLRSVMAKKVNKEVNSDLCPRAYFHNRCLP